jgi:hypothetical protein
MSQVSTTLTETVTASLLDGPLARRKTERNVATVDRDATFLTGSRSATTAASPLAPRTSSSRGIFARLGGFAKELVRQAVEVNPVKTIRLGDQWDIYEHTESNHAMADTIVVRRVVRRVLAALPSPSPSPARPARP